MIVGLLVLIFLALVFPKALRITFGIGALILVIGLIGSHSGDHDQISGARIQSVASTDSTKVKNTDVEEKACRPKDLSCLYDKFEIEARVKCGPEIERRAKYDFKWTETGLFGTYGQIFTNVSMSDTLPLIGYIGDKIQFQNGFGAMQRITYTCHFDTATKEVVGVDIQEGRI